MILLISYDLNGPERPSAYAQVAEMIEDNAVSWRKPLYSQWFVETDDSPNVWHERMKLVTDEDDKWFICRVGKERQGWLSATIWTWLSERV